MAANLMAADQPDAKPADTKPADAKAADAASAFANTKDKVSYCIGLTMGSSWKKQALDVNPDMVAKGLKEGLSDAKPVITDEEVRQTLMDFQKEMTTKQQEKAKVLGEKNKKDGEAFLAENKKKDGVKVTASGLQYIVEKEGSGAMPKATNTVVANYRGTLLDGTEFDSSYKRNEPAEFPVDGLIKGWTEALQLMKPGAKFKLFIPSELAYGEQGAGDKIGPNATLIFELELVEIK
jgi:FKBP-type peptidyl-prolyl cis-trans isomerase FklB